MPEEIRKSFHQHLDEVRRDIIRMGAMVSERIPWGTEILLTGNLTDAEELIRRDDELDALYWDIEERCYQLLALQQPMATDLRAVVSAIRMNSEIERSGDLMVNIAKATRRIYGTPIEAPVQALLQRLGEEAGRLFRLAMDAYADSNDGVASAMDDIDDGLDNLHAEYIKAILARGPSTDGVDLSATVQLALVGRYYERIGDHAVNIGERVHYLITGWLPERTGAARVQAAAAALGNGRIAGEPAATTDDPSEGS